MAKTQADSATSTKTLPNSANPSLLGKFGDSSNRLALILVGLGAVLRLLGLGSRPFWFDETISVFYARQDVGTLFTLNSGDNHPVGYYLTLKGWLALFGENETTVRLLSVGPGVVAIWLTWLIGRKLFPAAPRIALVATALMAFSPFQIYFSQEARNYSFLLMFALGAIWFWLQGLEKKGWQVWVEVGAMTALGLAFNLTTAFYLAAPGLYMLIGWRRYWQALWRYVVAVGGGGLVASVALLPKLNRLGAIKGNFWVPTPDLLIVLRTFYTFLFGAVPTERFVPAFALAFIILLVVLVQVGIGIFRDNREQSSLLQGQSEASRAKLSPTGAIEGIEGKALSHRGNRGHREQSSLLQNNSPVLTLWLLCGPLLLICVVSLVFQPIYLDKALIGCAPFYYLLIGWTLFRPGQEKKLAGRLLAFGTPVGLALLLALWGLPQIYNGTVNPLYIARYDAPRIDAFLASRYQAGDVVATATDISFLPLLYYDPKNMPPKFPIAEYPYPNVFPALLDRVGSAFVPQADFAKKYKRAWVVFEVNVSGNELSAPVRPSDLSVKPDWFHSPNEQQATLDWFNAHYPRLEAVYLDRVLLVLYQL